MGTLRDGVKRIPLLGGLLLGLNRLRRRLGIGVRRFQGSRAYWEERYASGGSSGRGSSGHLAAFKAEVLNDLVASESIESVLEFGCGDGSQLARASYPSYVGFDVSRTALASCRARFAADPTKRFAPMDDYGGETAELALSLDVVYHLVEDDVYEAHMHCLFSSATRFVVVYASNTEDDDARVQPHVRHRRFSDWVQANAPGWRLLRHVPNRHSHERDPESGSFAEFFVYAR